MKKFLVIIPAYNEEGNIDHVVEDAKKELSEIADILLVDDGSSDQTGQVARDIGICVLSLPINQGAGAAAQAGYIYARKRGYSFAGQMDADGQHRAADLRRLFLLLEKGSCNLAIGSRYLADSNYQSTRARRAGSLLFRSLLLLLTGKKISDITSGLRAGDEKIIWLFSQMMDPDYAEIESLQRALNSGLCVEEVSVSMEKRLSGKSSISSVGAFVYTAKNLLVLLAGALRARRDRLFMGRADL